MTRHLGLAPEVPFPGGLEDYKLEPTLFNAVNLDNGFFADAYTQQRPELLASPYYTSFNAHILADLPQTLIF
ncbi:hypothetical protein BG015_001966 [Linnemannia schmuckeri]|uniref:Uncharacterized protein n=1 Tax=Linnemannia schmuckeri TaxID=64567 RepID=A0A9P5V655_9FUNG|nr:hypothetical protein BG015_001966 [Linnemannia schmuckeri]